MNTDQLEKWIEENTRPMKDVDGFIIDAVYVDDLLALFAGKVLVPVEPTHEMIGAGQIASRYWSASDSKENGLAPIYRAMLAASQEPR